MAYASDLPTRCEGVSFEKGFKDPAHLDCTRVGFNVNDIPDNDALLLYRLVDTRIQSQLLGPLDGLQPDNHVRDRLSIPAQRILRLCRRQLCHLAFVHLLCLLDPEPDCTSKTAAEDLGLFHFAAEYLGADHGTEGHLVSEFLGECERERGLERMRG